MSFIPYGRQCITKEDIETVVQTLESDFLTQGPVGGEFEDACKQAFNSTYALSCNSATSGLHMAYEALGFGKGDTLWTSPNTFVATSNMALHVGGDVDFVDIDPDTYCMCMKALEAKLIQAKANNSLPKIITPVHFAGQSCNMKKLKELADEYGFFIVEDAAHAVGAVYNDKPVGACEFSDIAVFSFHPVKIITTGEGGMVTTNSAELAQKMADIRSHGVTKDEKRFTKPSEGPWFYEQQSLGCNYRMCDIQSALGFSQISRLAENIKSRIQISEVYKSQLAGLPLTFQKLEENAVSSWHLFVIKLEDASKRLEFFNYLCSKNIGVQIHYIPVHTQPYYKNLGFKEGLCPNAEDYYSRCISIPMYHTLTNADQQYVIDTIKKFF